MKKLVLLTLAATVVAGSAFAAAPVTKISDGSTKVQATVFNSSAKSVPEFGKTTTTSRPASTTNSNSGIPDIPVFMKR